MDIKNKEFLKIQKRKYRWYQFFAILGIIILLFAILKVIKDNLIGIGFNLIYFYVTLFFILFILFLYSIILTISLIFKNKDPIKVWFNLCRSFINFMKNKYLIATFLLILLTLVTATSFLNQSFRDKFPYFLKLEQPQLDKYEDMGRFLVECNNFFERHNDFVEGDELNCLATLDFYPRYKNITISRIRVQEQYPKDQQIENKDCSTSNNKCQFIIKLDKTGKNEFQVEYFFFNGNEDKRIYYSNIEIDVLSNDKYQDKQNNKTTLTLGSIFVLIFTIIVAMKNLKDLIENK